MIQLQPQTDWVLPNPSSDALPSEHDLSPVIHIRETVAAIRYEARYEDEDGDRCSKVCGLVDVFTLSIERRGDQMLRIQNLP